MNSLDDFLKVLNDIKIFFDEICNLELQKIEYIKNKNSVGLEKLMPIEQALVMKFKGLDKKREKLQNELSFSNKSFRQILPLIPDKDKNRARSIFDTLTTKMNEYKGLSDISRQHIETRLYDINTALAKADAKKNGMVYDQSGQLKNSTAPRFKSKRV